MQPIILYALLLAIVPTAVALLVGGLRRYVPRRLPRRATKRALRAEGNR
jgi:hypothetical protein